MTRFFCCSCKSGIMWKFTWYWNIWSVVFCLVNWLRRLNLISTMSYTINATWIIWKGCLLENIKNFAFNLMPFFLFFFFNTMWLLSQLIVFPLARRIFVVYIWYLFLIFFLNNYMYIMSTSLVYVLWEQQNKTLLWVSTYYMDLLSWKL